MPVTPIEAADALLRVIVKGDRERFAARLAAFKGRPFMDPGTSGATDVLDVAGLAADPVGTACRAELRRIGNAIYAAGVSDALSAAKISVAEMDRTYADWRTIVLESVWAGIRRRVS
ncbi:hypothetical protein [Methylobacterium longum]|uniref:Uncharacterized protein n=1 Tax=Methylobacterium longum TaxID=767694 RepID=A0ABT8B0M7_9HYPH|nr:hypothetical protein [Methylobacterium longum]MDN3575068.1 hypothetical protein [Methylobacterium longum]GJE14788.1 hypothetical protein FOHLNKBM_5863 [Methylobacterium longum]